MNSVVRKPIIAIDIDDVIADSASRLIEYSNDHWGTSLTIDDYSEDFSILWQTEPEETWRRVQEYFNSGIHNNYNHRLDALEAFEELKNNYHLILVTSRNGWLKEDTVRWVKNKYPYFFNDDDIYFVGIWDKGVSDVAISSDKGEFVKNLGVDFIIDDQLKHCIGASRNGIQALLFGDYSWNKADDLPEKVRRVSNWLEVVEYFKTLE